MENEMILYYYGGRINNTVVDGNATLFAEPRNGVIEGTVLFRSLDDLFTPAFTGFSVLSICCVCKSRTEGETQNILSLTNGKFTSIRDIEAFDERGNLIGNLSINGLFSRKGEGVVVGDVTITGRYSGPVDLKVPDGYELPLNPEAEYRLTGEFRKTYISSNGMRINTINKQRYIFDDGVTSRLKPVISIINYNADRTYWDSENKIMRLSGYSKIRPGVGGPGPGGPGGNN